jgi:diaminopimelate epimerase
MTHPFQRYTAAGNTFILMNTWDDPLSLSREEMRMLVKKSCDHNEGVGADGVILINQSFSAPFRMDFYNPDGTTGMLCGNGSRCAAIAARDFGFVSADRTDFEVLGSINSAEFLSNSNVRVFFQDPTIIRLNFELPIEENKNIIANYVDLGSQHVVIFYDEIVGAHGDLGIDEMDVEYFGPLVRWHPDFAPLGANANFIEVRENGDGKYIRIRTFERGVEGETLACGTGCMSSAIVAHLTGRISQTPVRLLTQSGEFVTVNFKAEGEHISQLSLEGSIVRGEKGILRFDEETGRLDVEYA